MSCMGPGSNRLPGLTGGARDDKDARLFSQPLAGARPCVAILSAGIEAQTCLSAACAYAPPC
jgi:hypothetical protein